jgi:chromosome segregation ATPase
MRDITVMDNLTPSDLPPQSGWIAALILAAAGLLKGAWPWLRSRDAAHAKLTKEERDAARAEERDLVATLKAAITKHEERIAALEGRVDGLISERSELLTDKAELVIKLAHANAEIERLTADNARLRDERAGYRNTAVASGTRLAEVDPAAGQQVLEEVSEADDATSQAGSKLP